MELAICLAGGGVKGAAHIGVLQAIEEENIKYNYIAGASSGSIVASLNAMGYSANEIYVLFKKYCKKIKYIDFKQLTKIIWGLIVRRELIIDGLNSGEIIEKIVNEAAMEKGIRNINEIKRNLLIPSVDLNTGTVYMFSSLNKRNGYSDEIKYINDINIGKAVRASCSYPGVFSPCKYKNIEFVDGGIRENIPWKEVKASGAAKVFCVKFQKNRKMKEKKNIIDVVAGSMDLLGQELANYEIEGADYVLNLKTKSVSLLDFTQIDYLYELGYKQGKEYIKTIRNKLK